MRVQSHYTQSFYRRSKLAIENWEGENPFWMSCQNFANETGHHAVASHLLWVIQLTHCWTGGLIAILDLKDSPIGGMISSVIWDQAFTVPLETTQNSWSMKHAILCKRCKNVVNCMPFFVISLLTSSRRLLTRVCDTESVACPMDSGVTGRFTGCHANMSSLKTSAGWILCQVLSHF